MAKCMLEQNKLKLLSTKFDMKMHADQFDSRRKVLTTIFKIADTIYSSCATIQSPVLLETKVYGSTGEGINYPLNGSYEKDIDIALISRTSVAVERIDYAVSYQTPNGIYLIENEQSIPGYCYLRQIKESPWYGFPNFLFPLTSDISGLRYLSGSAIKEFMKKYIINADLLSQSRDFCGEVHYGQIEQKGPANYFHFKFEILHPMGVSKADYVFLTRCPKWPSLASEWITRRRPYGWPTEKQIKEIVAKGIYFAPVGCKGHRNGDLQWRYSFNEAEKRLVLSFNTTQAKCYALLKRVISENVTPHFENDVISSYHLKTIMFWTIERTDPENWVPANLIEWVFNVLHRLLQCVEKGNCPSYFIPDENLFLHKVTEENKKSLQECIEYIIEIGWPVLTRLSNFAIDHVFIRYIQGEYESQEYAQDGMIQDFIFTRSISHGYIESTFLPFYLVQADVFKLYESDRICSYFNDLLNTLIRVVNACDDATVKEIMTNIVALVCSSYGTHCLSFSLYQSVEISETSEVENVGDKYIELSCLRKQLACLVKHANYAYMRGNLQSTLFTADNIIQMYFNHSQNSLSSYARLDVQIQDIIYRILNYEVEKGNLLERRAVMAGQMCPRGDVIFMKNEIYGVPGNAKVEMFMVGHVPDPLNPLSRCRQCLVVDPYLYTTYLGFLTYFDMRLQEEADKAISTMEIICSVSPNSHLPASLNLLGDCYLKRGKIDKAMEKFSLSMQRNSMRNAAPWHVVRLVWRKLLDRWLKTRDEDY